MYFKILIIFNHEIKLIIEKKKGMVDNKIIGSNFFILLLIRRVIWVSIISIT